MFVILAARLFVFRFRLYLKENVMYNQAIYINTIFLDMNNQNDNDKNVKQIIKLVKLYLIFLDLHDIFTHLQSI